MSAQVAQYQLHWWAEAFGTDLITQTMDITRQSNTILKKLIYFYSKFKRKKVVMMKLDERHHRDSLKRLLKKEIPGPNLFSPGHFIVMLHRRGASLKRVKGTVLSASGPRECNLFRFLHQPRVKCSLCYLSGPDYPKTSTA